VRPCLKEKQIGMKIKVTDRATIALHWSGHLGQCNKKNETGITVERVSEYIHHIIDSNVRQY
jgi:hypothetical protein